MINKMKVLFFAVLAVCMCRLPCTTGEACLQAYVECPCRWASCSHVPVGFHSYSTTYTPSYRQVDLDFNRTRYDIRKWLHLAFGLG